MVDVAAMIPQHDAVEIDFDTAAELMADVHEQRPRLGVCAEIGPGVLL